MATQKKTPPEPSEEFRRFEQLARKIANVPKAREAPETKPVPES